MSRYLLVAHRTARSPQLRAKVLELIQDDPDAEFVLLVPATEPGLLPLVTGESRSRRELARYRARRGVALLREVGARVTATRIGGADPFLAVSEELLGERYEAVVISTLPHTLSHWLRADLLARVRRRFPGQRVIHVVGTPLPWEALADANRTLRADALREKVEAAIPGRK